MPLIDISKPEDIKKLIGWRIDDVRLILGVPPKLILRLGHIAAGNQVDITFTPCLTPKVSTGGVEMPLGINIASEDVPEPEGEASGQEGSSSGKA